VSSFVALKAMPVTITSMSYGMAKIALERMTIDLARQLAPDPIAVNCFRVDAPVASEGARAHMPDADFTDWEAPDVAAEGIAWMLRQPVTYTGQLESMSHLARREGIMSSVAARPGRLPPTEFG
jgi:citronellol/citronellal dehydrogenase